MLIHHSTKGNQSGKTITDVGAGSQSRTTDTHLIRDAREHTEPEGTAERFVEAFVTAEMREKLVIVQAATDAGLSERKAERLLREAEQQELVVRDQKARNRPASFSLSVPALPRPAEILVRAR